MIVWIASFAATFYFATLIILYLGQRSFIYLPETRWIEPEQVGASDFETVEIASGQTRLKAWWKAPPAKGAPVILHFHGNGGSVADRAGIYRQLTGGRYGILAAEYPGYAGNGGELSEDSFFAAGQSYYDWLKAQGYEASQIIIAGQSLGTGVAVNLASENAAAGLLLEAPYSSIADVAARAVPWIPVRWLLKDQYDSQSRIARIDMPLAWVHGDRDNVIDMSFGQKLFDAARNPKCAHIIEGAGHNDLWNHDIAAFFHSNIESMMAGKGCVSKG